MSTACDGQLLIRILNSDTGAQKVWDVRMAISGHRELLKDRVLVWFILGAQHCPAELSKK